MSPQLRDDAPPSPEQNQKKKKLVEVMDYHCLLN